MKYSVLLIFFPQPFNQVKTHLNSQAIGNRQRARYAATVVTDQCFRATLTSPTHGYHVGSERHWTILEIKFNLDRWRYDRDAVRWFLSAGLYSLRQSSRAETRVREEREEELRSRS